MCVIIHKEGLAHFPIRGTQAWPRACPERSRTPALFRPPTLVSLPHMEIAAIQTHGLTRRFGALTAVDDVTLSVAPGQFFGFLGPNGAGKSTTIKMLTGLLEPSAGTIEILGRPFWAGLLDLKRQIGVVPEGMALLGRLTAPEYLHFVDRKSTRLNSSHLGISYAVFCLK